MFILENEQSIQRAKILLTAEEYIEELLELPTAQRAAIAAEIADDILPMWKVAGLLDVSLSYINQFRHLKKDNNKEYKDILFGRKTINQRKRRNKINVPIGYKNLEEATRKTLQEIGEDCSSKELANELNIDKKSALLLKRIILASNNNNLKEEDRKKISKALDLINQTNQIKPASILVSDILVESNAVQHSDNKQREHFKKCVDKLSGFSEGMGQLIVPKLSLEERDFCCNEIQRAIQTFRSIQRQLKKHYL